MSLYKTNKYLQMGVTKTLLIRSVASSTAMETDKSIEQIEKTLKDKKLNAHQDIDMQIERLTKILDDLYNHTNNNYGSNHSTTRRALKAVLYLHALKCDLEALKKDVK